MEKDEARQIISLQNEVRKLRIQNEQLSDMARLEVASRTSDLERQLKKLKSSLSWRITSPIRELNRFFRKIKTAVAKLAQHRHVANISNSASIPSAVTDPAPLGFDIIGHANGSYSLAEVNRSIVRALNKFGSSDVRLTPIEGTSVSLGNGDYTDLNILQKATEKILSERQTRIAFVQHYPIHIPQGDFDFRALYFFWEESLIPDAMVAKINKNFDAFLAPTRFVAKAAIDSGVRLPVRVIGYPGDFAQFQSISLRREERRSSVEFLHISSCFPRKGADILIKSFSRAFSSADPVRLLIKGSQNPHNIIPSLLKQVEPGGGRIEYIDNNLLHRDLLELYADADVMVLPSRGEGLNLPAAEALAAGLKLIVTANGGHVDFVTPAVARLIEYSIEESRTHFSQPGSLWFEPNEMDLIAALQEAATDIRSKPRSVHGGTSALGFFDPGSFARNLERTTQDLLSFRKKESAKIALITTFDVACGIAEYSRFLVTAMTEDPSTKVRIFCDNRTEKKPREVDVEPTWRIGGKAREFTEAASAIVDFAPDVVFVQYHPGFYNAKALHSLLVRSSLSRRTRIITFHQVKFIAQLSPSNFLLVKEIINSVDRVIAHTVYDMNLLKALGAVDNVALVPQGVEIIPDIKRRFFEKEDCDPIIGSYGFAFPHKGIHELIDAFAIIKTRKPGAKLRLVNSDYNAHPVAVAEIARCKDRAFELGIADDITWLTDFMSHSESMHALSNCTVIALPYRDTAEASSAAVRSAVSSRRPVAVTPLRIFKDVEGAVFQLPGDDPQSIAEGLIELIENDSLRSEILNNADNWIAAHSWTVIGHRVNGMVRGLMNAR